jgi:hypothetical protein
VRGLVDFLSSQSFFARLRSSLALLGELQRDCIFVETGELQPMADGTDSHSRQDSARSSPKKNSSGISMVRSLLLWLVAMDLTVSSPIDAYAEGNLPCLTSAAHDAQEAIKEGNTLAAVVSYIKPRFADAKIFLQGKNVPNMGAVIPIASEVPNYPGSQGWVFAEIGWTRYIPLLNRDQLIVVFNQDRQVTRVQCERIDGMTMP